MVVKIIIDVVIAPLTPAHSYRYNSYTFYFSTAANQAAFAASPETYLPKCVGRG